MFTIGYVAFDTGSGLGAWMEAQSAYPHRESVEWVSMDIGNRSTILFISVGMFFWFCCTHGANQVALQRYFTVESVRAARKSYLVSALSSFALSIILAGVGLSLLYFIQNHELPAAPGVQAADQSIRYEAQDKIFPQFIRFYLPSGLRGLDHLPLEPGIRRIQRLGQRVYGIHAELIDQNIGRRIVGVHDHVDGVILKGER